MIQFNPLHHPADDMRGIHAIEASAGTGKTYSITIIWLRLLLEHGVAVEEILVSTFTKAATGELRERLLAGLEDAAATLVEFANNPEATLCKNAKSGPGSQVVVACLEKDIDVVLLLQRLAAARSDFDLAPISTLHGFCQRILRDHSFHVDADPAAEPQADLGTLVDDLADAMIIDLMHRDKLTVLGDNPVQTVRQLAQNIAKNPGLARAQIYPQQTDPANLRDRLETTINDLKQFRQMWADSTGRSKKAALQRFDEACSGDPSQIDKSLTPKAREAIEASDAASSLALYDQIVAAATTLNDLPRANAIAALIDQLHEQLRVQQDLQGIMTYDDLLLRVRDALRGSDSLAQAIRSTLKVAIIDECQDSDAIQIEIFRRLFTSNNRLADDARLLVVIGDPKQSIYRFRHADLASYRALTALAGANQYTMTTNYRSDQAVIAGLNELYANAPEFSGSDHNNPITYQQVSANENAARLHDPASQRGAVSFLWSDASKRVRAKDELTTATAAEINRLINGAETHLVDRQSGAWRPLHAGDIAIVAATHQELVACRRALYRYNIPCQQAGRGLGSVFSSNEAQDMATWLALLGAVAEHNAEHRHLLRSFVSNPLGQLAAASADAAHGGIGAGGATPIGQWLDDSDLHGPLLITLLSELEVDLLHLRQDGPLPLLLRFLQRHGGHQTASFQDGERRLTNWRHLAQLLHDEWTQGRRQPATLHAWLTRHIANPPNDESTDMMWLETDEAAVQLVTVHAAKGLEYPIVFCPFLWIAKGKNHTLKAIRMSEATSSTQTTDTLYLDGALNNDITDANLQANRDEAQRTCYVALTRARHRVYIGAAPLGKDEKTKNGVDQSALGPLIGWTAENSDDWLQPDDLGKGASSDATFAPATPATEQEVPQIADKPPLIDPRRGESVLRVGSFSGLTRLQHDETPRDTDLDTFPDRSPDINLGINLDTGQQHVATSPATSTNTDLLAGLGAGTTLGNQVHDALEAVLGNGESWEKIEKTLHQQFTLSNPAAATTPIHPDASRLSAALQRFTQTSLPLQALGENGDTTASKLPPLHQLTHNTIAEMHFLLPTTTITASDLSRALLDDPVITNNPQRHAWAKGIAAWNSATLRGFLQGYIDLVVEHEDRWFVLDYKTNQLDDYSPTGLEAAMLHSHYLLQGRIYCLALDLHLRTCRSDYDPERHLGGMIYCFVRGLDAPGNGVWYDRPTAAGLAALHRLHNKSVVAS